MFLDVSNHHIYLCFTSLLLLSSVFYFVYKRTKGRLIHDFEYILVFLLFIVVVFSLLFWSNPIQHSTIHKIDAIVAKVAVVVFVAFVMLYKFHVSFLFMIVAIAVLFYISNYFSTKEWCCSQHLISHGFLHLCCVIASFYAFV